MTIDSLKNLKMHLNRQIEEANKTKTDWIYLRKNEAEKCLELAECEETIFMKPVRAEVEGGGHTWWFVCGECRSSINPRDKYCHECGRKMKWK